jgi:HSP20 family molecular chaperone IbpA
MLFRLCKSCAIKKFERIVTPDSGIFWSTSFCTFSRLFTRLCFYFPPCRSQVAIPSQVSRNRALDLENTGFLEPFRQAELMSRQMDNLIGNMFGARSPFSVGFPSLFSGFPNVNRQVSKGFQELGLPGQGIVADVEETKSSYLITAEVPGVDKSLLNVEVDHEDHAIIISAEKTLSRGDQELLSSGSGSTEVQKQSSSSSSTSAEESPKLHRAERLYGSMKRVIGLNNDADLENVNAKLENGVLTITVGKLEGVENVAARKRVNIQ